MEDQFLELIRENSEITLAQMAEILNTSVHTMNRILNDLKEQNKIKRSGSKKEGFYEIHFNAQRYTRL